MVRERSLRPLQASNFNFFGLSESYTVPCFPLSFPAWFLVVRGTSAEAPGQGRQGQACACCAAYSGCRARFPGRVQGSPLNKLRMFAFLKTSKFMQSQHQQLSIIWRHAKTTLTSPHARFATFSFIFMFSLFFFLFLHPLPHHHHPITHLPFSRCSSKPSRRAQLAPG